MLQEENFIPYTSGDLPSGPYLVFAPHPDDETFGMGGTILKASQADIAVHVVVLTDGQQAGDPEKRRQEAKDVSQVLGLAGMDFWGLQDRELHRVTDMESRVLKILKSVTPRVVFLPSMQEFHPDHRAATLKIWLALQKLNYSGQLWTYEITRQAEANRLIDITQVIPIKQQAMRCYKSQLALNNYEAVNSGLNQARALTLQKGITHAEAFFEYDDWCNLNPYVASLKAIKLYWQHGNLPDNFPLVSIIVRTKNRPKLLEKALGSIEAQDYRPIEVVIVNDGGMPLESELLQSILGNIKLNYIDLKKNQGRTTAGNIGIKEAKGEYIGFLDDDDEFYPDHITTLMNLLLNIDYKVAYTDSEMVQIDYDPIQKKEVISKKQILFSQDFSYEFLLFRNYIPLMCLLFHHCVFDSVHGFDDTLDLYEDWDLLIRIAKDYPFYHIKRVTAQYRQWSKTLQITSYKGLSKRDYLKVLNKHITFITPEVLFTLYQIDVKNNEKSVALKDEIFNLSQKISTLKRENKSQNREIEAIKGENQSLNNDIEAISNSVGWRVLVKFLCFRDKVLPYSTLRRRIFWESWFSIIKRHFRVSTKGISGKHNPEWPVLSLPNTSIYASWMEKHSPSSQNLEKQRKECQNWQRPPLLSVIVPIYNTPSEWLNEALNSTFNQSYSHWEAVLVDDASTVESTTELIEKWVGHDPRFRLIRRSRNGGVGQASQDGILAAKGLFVMVLDHDDQLEPNALYEISKCLEKNVNVDIFYSDEVLIDPKGNVIKVMFRPDYSYNYLLSHPYIVHLTAFRRDLVMRAGGFNVSYPVSQDYDLLLRLAAQTDRFYHIPKVLYRWRIHGKSAGHKYMGSVMKLSKQSITRHLELKGVKDAIVEDGLSFNFFRVRYNIKPARLSIIIPTRDRLDLLKGCIDSLLEKTCWPPGITFQLVIADNNSSHPETLDYLENLQNQGHKVVACPGLFNFSVINNRAVRKSDGDILLFLNNDIIIDEGSWAEALIEHVQRPEVGTVGAKLLYPDGRIQHAGVITGINKGTAGHSHQFFPEYSIAHLEGGHLNNLLCVRECLAVTAACMMVRRDVFEMVGGFDESYEIAFGDTDLCLRIYQKGLMNLWTPYARLIHHESASRGKASIETHPEDTARFRKIWKELINRGDPFYNPNLSSDSPNFTPR